MGSNINIFALKKAFHVDLVAPLSTYFRTTYQKSSSDDLKRIVKIFQDDRTFLVEQLNSNVDLEQMLKALDTWLVDIFFLYDYLNLSQDDNTCITFGWTDTFWGQKCFCSSWMFELCQSLFTLAIICTFLGIQGDRQKANGSRETLKYFKSARSIFKFLKTYTTPSISHECGELDPTCLQILELISDAQANVLLYEKGVSDQYNRSLLSKLAYNVSLQYLTALNTAENIAEKKILPSSLLIVLKVQHYAFLAAAHLQKALHHLVEVKKRSEGYGIILGRLKLVKDLCDRAEMHANKKKEGIPIDLTTIRTKASDLYNEIDKDNRLIYLEAIVPKEKLPELEKLNTNTEEEENVTIGNLKTHLGLKHEISIEVQAFFPELIPGIVTDAISTIIQRSKQCLAEYNLFLDDKKKTFEEICSIYNLESLLDQQITDNEVIDRLWMKFQQIREVSAIVKCPIIFSKLKEDQSNLLNKLTKMESALREEEERNEAYVKRFGKQWTMPRSRDHNSCYFNPLYEYKNSLEKAQKINEELEKDLEQSKQYHSIIVDTKENLQCYIKQFQPAKKNDNPNGLYSQAKNNISKYQNTLHTFEQKIKSFNINLAEHLLKAKSELMNVWKQKKTDLTGSMDYHIAVFESLVESSELQTNKTLVEEAFCKFKTFIVSHCDELKMITHSDDGQTSAAEKLEKTSDRLMEIYTTITEGENFFKLLDGYLEMLQEEVERWVTQRKQESFNILKMIGLQRQQQTSNVLRPGGEGGHTYNHPNYLSPGSYYSASPLNPVNSPHDHAYSLHTYPALPNSPNFYFQQRPPNQQSQAYNFQNFYLHGT